MKPMFRFAPQLEVENRRRVLMITNEVFVLILGVFLGGLVFWAFKRLPEADRLTD
jgi:hypothetical protein